MHIFVRNELLLHKAVRKNSKHLTKQTSHYNDFAHMKQLSLLPYEVVIAFSLHEQLALW